MLRKNIALVLVLSFVMVGCHVQEEKKQKQHQVENQKSRLEVAEDQLAQAIESLNNSNIEQAIKSLQVSIVANPGKPEAYILLGETYIRTNQFNEALPVLGKAAQKFPDTPVIFYLLAISNRATGNLAPAVLSMKRAVELFKEQGNEKQAQKAVGFLAQWVKQAQDAEAVQNSKEEPTK